jgi:anti-sigma regulatory factor (Ser/Thr protein kinase)
MHEYGSKVRIWELTCPDHLEEVGRARRWTRDVLSDSGHADDAALIVTELGTNALLHSTSGNQGEAFSLTISRTPETVLISVTDAGGTRTTPHVEHPDENDTHGRGLALVSTLAQRLHINGDDKHGHTVTAELTTSTATVPNVPTTQGYWCECLVNGGKIGSLDATSPEQSLRWVRITLMTIAMALDQARCCPSRGKLTSPRSLAPRQLQPKAATPTSKLGMQPVPHAQKDPCAGCTPLGHHGIVLQGHA